jgi:hypothetical protein
MKTYTGALNRQCPIGSTQATAVAGSYPHVQIWNPAGTGVFLAVEKILFSTAATGVRVITATAALTNDGAEFNKYLGGAAPLGQVKYENNVTFQGVSTVIILTCLTARMLEFKFNDPFILPESHGLNLAAGAVNVELKAVFQWREVKLP